VGKLTVISYNRMQTNLFKANNESKVSTPHLPNKPTKEAFVSVVRVRACCLEQYLSLLPRTLSTRREKAKIYRVVQKTNSD
jgi:hypothetical protein